MTLHSRSLARAFQRKPPGGGEGAQGGAGGASGDAPGAEGSQGAPDAASSLESGSDRPVVCAACGHALTLAKQAISVAGSHTHTFMNPGGFVFEIACYKDAPGARPAGLPSNEWSWFPGYVWQVALCAACKAHVGWSFRSEGSGHFGLVRDRIAEGGD